jgi:hypothetical protein
VQSCDEHVAAPFRICPPHHPAARRSVVVDARGFPDEPEPRAVFHETYSEFVILPCTPDETFVKPSYFSKKVGGQRDVSGYEIHEGEPVGSLAQRRKTIAPPDVNVVGKYVVLFPARVPEISKRHAAGIPPVGFKMRVQKARRSLHVVVQKEQEWRSGEFGAAVPGRGGAGSRLFQHTDGERQVGRAYPGRCAIPAAVSHNDHLEDVRRNGLPGKRSERR